MKFEHVAVVQADPALVFEMTQDYSRRLSWDPFLRHAELCGGAVAPGVGVRAWCVARLGPGMETEYVSFAPPRIAAFGEPRQQREVQQGPEKRQDPGQ